MAEGMSYNDVRQLYGNVLTLRKGRLVKVREVHDTTPVTITYYDLKSKRRHTLEFNREDFKTITRRIGYINMNKKAYYVIRNPRRVYVNGFHFSNIEIRVPSGSLYDKYGEGAKDVISAMEDTSILSAYENDYPSLSKAIDLAKEWDSSCAFDKQFSVNSDGLVHYKERWVGKVVGGAIEFISAYQYLQALLDGNHEKTSRTFGSKAL